MNTMIACTAALCAITTVTCSDLSHKYFDYQEMCMHKTIGVPRCTNLRQYLESQCIYDGTAKSNAVCDWLGVACEDKKVVSIEWNDHTYPIIHTINWLPASARVVSMTDKGVSSSLPTQDLPRSLVSLTLSNCGLKGYLSLRRLPRGLEVLMLPRNKFQGNLSLTALPPSMRIVNVRYSPIKTVFVENGNLPWSLEDIIVGDGPVDTKIVGLDGEPDKRVHKPF